MTPILANLDRSIMGKYDIYAFDYIEYPHKSFWSDKFGDAGYRDGLKELFAPGTNHPVVLYLHIPFCPQMCYFCVCHFKITHDYDRIKHYLPHLHAEIKLLKDFFDQNKIKPNFKEIHLGGGSPTYLQEAEFLELKEKLKTIAQFDQLEEFTIEIDPRRVNRERMHFYADQGIDRISFGIQDFDLEVQETINRVQPPELVENLLTPDVRKRFKSVNFDILCGLPKQTKESMRKTIERVIKIGPDRIALSFMHFSPRFAPHQMMMKKNVTLPDFTTRKLLHEEAVETLCRSGYVRTGFEHFAKPEDEVAQAVKNKTVQYNSLGATPGRCSYLLGLGESAYSRIGEHHYSQHVYEQNVYENEIAAGRFPVFRGHKLSQDDVVRRFVIQKLRSLFSIDKREVEAKFGINFDEYFAAEKPLEEEFVRDGMLTVSENEITVTELGKNFSNLVCKIFDKYARGSNYPEDFFEAPKVFL